MRQVEEEREKQMRAAEEERQQLQLRQQQAQREQEEALRAQMEREEELRRLRLMQGRLHLNFWSSEGRNEMAYFVLTPRLRLP